MHDIFPTTLSAGCLVLMRTLRTSQDLEEQKKKQKLEHKEQKKQEEEAAKQEVRPLSALAWRF